MCIAHVIESSGLHLPEPIKPPSHSRFLLCTKSLLARTICLRYRIRKYFNVERLKQNVLLYRNIGKAWVSEYIYQYHSTRPTNLIYSFCLSKTKRLQLSLPILQKFKPNVFLSRLFVLLPISWSTSRNTCLLLFFFLSYR